jgi:hypothetical protein
MRRHGKRCFAVGRSGLKWNANPYAAAGTDASRSWQSGARGSIEAAAASHQHMLHRTHWGKCAVASITTCPKLDPLKNDIMPRGNGDGRGKAGRGGSPPHDDLEDLLRRSQDKLRQVMPGGSGLPGSFIFLLAAVIMSLAAFFAFTFRVEPDELGIVMRFGKPEASRQGCTSASPIRSKRYDCQGDPAEHYRGRHALK